MATGSFGYSWDDKLSTPGGAIGSLPGSQTGQGGAGFGSGFSDVDRPKATDQNHIMDVGQPQLTPPSDANMGGNFLAKQPLQLGMVQTNDPGMPDPSGGHEPGGFTGQPDPGNSAVLEHMNNVATQLKSTTDPAQAAVLHDQLSRHVSQTLQAQGHEVKFQDDGTIMVDGRPYQVAGGAPTAQPAATAAPQMWHSSPTEGVAPGDPAAPASFGTSAARHNTPEQESFIQSLNTGGALDDGSGFDANFRPGETNDQYAARLEQWKASPHGSGDMLHSWMPDADSTYKPGDIGFGDIPDFSYDSLLQKMNNPDVDASMKDLLAHPESLDERAVSTMKAASKDELADQQQAQEGDLKALGAEYGIDESPWLASQQLASRQGRDNAVIQSNRAIDMQAAQVNKADKRAAAQLGLEWQNQKTAGVQAAVSASLDRAAAIGGRMALRESVAQQAAQLHISAQALMANHIQFQLGQLMQKYGIDINAQMQKYGIDTQKDLTLKQLAQADKMHLEDLSLKMKELDETIAGRKQQDDQFRAGHDLDVEKEKLNQDKWDWATSHPSDAGIS